MGYLRPHFLPILLLTAGFCALAQSPPAVTAPQAPSVPAPTTQTPPPPTPLPPSRAAEAERPPYSSFSDVSIGLSFWETRAQPFLRIGTGFDLTTGTTGNLDFTRKEAPTVGAEVNIPVGKGSMLRVNYWHLRVAGNSYITTPSTLFSQSLNPGDFVNLNYKIQNLKFTWDYLSYPYPPENSKFRIRFLFEGQYTTITPTINAPLKVDASGNPLPVSAQATQWFIYPALGAAIERSLTRRFRLEFKGSGFALPRHSTLWDAEASANYRVNSRLEVVLEGRDFHFRTTPQKDEYMHATLPAIGLGVRWYP